MVATSELTTMIYALVQGNTELGTVNVNSAAIFQSPFYTGRFHWTDTCACHVDKFVVFPCSHNDVPTPPKHTPSMLELLTDLGRDILVVCSDCAL